MDQLLLQKGKRKKRVSFLFSKYIESPHDEWWVKDTNNEGSKDSNFTLGLQRECDEVKNSVSPTIHPDSTLERNPLPFALAHTNVPGTHYLRNAKEFMSRRGK